MTKENLVKTPAARVRRNPVEGRNKLKLKGGDPNYVYRFVNDTDDRVREFQDAGWELETDDTIRVGDSRIDDNARLGKVRMISVGQGQKAVLMKIKREWYEDDQKAKQEFVDKSEEAMRPNPDGQYGKVELTRK